MNKIVIIAVILMAMSGCYYIHQDWDMYDSQQHQRMTQDAGRE